MTTEPQPVLASRFDRLAYAFAKHWLAVILTFVLFYVGMPILAPVLMHLGMEEPAQTIYQVYRPLCHQLASTSYSPYS